MSSRVSRENSIAAQRSTWVWHDGEDSIPVLWLSMEDYDGRGTSQNEKFTRLYSE